MSKEKSLAATARDSTGRAPEWHGDCRTPVVTACAIGVLAFGLLATNHVFVSPEAGPGGDGSADSPTDIRTALQIARERRASGVLDEASPVVIHLGPGDYWLDQPLRLTADDSGTAESLLILDGDGRATLSSGTRVTGWQEIRIGRLRVWTAPVANPEMRQLWVNGQRRTLARTPDVGTLRVVSSPDSAGARYDEGQNRFAGPPRSVPSVLSTNGVEAVVCSRWIDSHLKVRSIDSASGWIECENASRLRIDVGDAFYVEGAKEFLNRPGEWWVDRSVGLLYYIPMPGEKISTALAVVPGGPTVVELTGSAARPITNVELRNLRVAHTEWQLPSGTSGLRQSAFGSAAAIEARYARGCSFNQVRVENVGGSGIAMRDGCTQNSILGAVIRDFGATGIQIGAAWQSECGWNVVEGCEVRDGGRVFHNGAGIWIGRSSGNVVRDNLIQDLYYTGISVGWSWGFDDAGTESNTIEGNTLRNIGAPSNGFGPILNDLGAIYTLGVQPGTKIVGNRIESVRAVKYGGWGIYLDEGSSGIEVFNNLVTSTRDGGFHLHYGRDNLVANNIFAYGESAQIRLSADRGGTPFTFVNNIVLFRQGDVFSGIAPVSAIFTQNLYWREQAPTRITFAGMTFGEWQALDQDAGSLVANPQFVNARRGDFRLRQTSPALGLGFAPFL